MSSSNFGSALMSIFSLPGKNCRSDCKIHPEVFASKIINTEASSSSHSLHPKHLVRSSLISKNFDIVPLSKKFGIKNFFNLKFWTRIRDNLYTELDNNIFEFAKVGVVLKNKDLSEKPQGWRLIWRSEPIIKFYDLLRSKTIDQSCLNNFAYKPNSSTFGALSKVSSMTFGKSEAIFAADFSSAFDVACRHCVNQITNTKLLPNLINFEVEVANQVSRTHHSLVGTGAGRPSGGGSFNILLDSLFFAADVNFQNLSAYADDSVIKVDALASSVESLVEKFKTGTQFGLSVHLSGSKAPCLLVRPDFVHILNVDNVSVVKETKFLGIMLQFDKNGSVVGKICNSVYRKLNFLVHSLTSGFKTAIYESDHKEFVNILKMCSIVIANLIESRIAYHVWLTGQKSRIVNSANLRISATNKNF